MNSDEPLLKDSGDWPGPADRLFFIEMQKLLGILGIRNTGSPSHSFYSGFHKALILYIRVNW